MNDHRHAQYAAFVLRVSMGIMFLAHGLVLKVMTFGFAGTAGFFESIGYPGIFAHIVILAEILGGIALIFGVLTRLVSILFLPIMLGALALHLPNGWVFSAPNGGWEFPAFWTVMLVVQALLGDGAFALQSRLPFGSRQATA
ncbi:MAG TPA: DoxX family protein [Azospirillaceae bacterium]|nr:DoxX family protein [Azospirillaceae bacterium]